jgi:hypothetical protein
MKWAIAFLIILSACGGGAVWSTLQIAEGRGKGFSSEAGCRAQ